MKRGIALVLSAVAVLVVAADPVAAAPSAPASGKPASTAIPSDAIGVALALVSTNGLAVTLDPGATEEHDLVVSNHTSDLRLTVRLTATDASGNLGKGAASWLAFADDVVQLDPHAATTVPMNVAVPHDTQPGPELMHVVATVESAVAAADGTPRNGSAHTSFPVAVTVRGTPTAQVAIADVHRVDEGSNHELALVLRNFGDSGARVSGHVKVASGAPQTLQFNSELAASRDSTVNLPWKAPPVGTPTEIAVDVEYGSGDVASWSSTLGAPPTTLSAPDTTPVTTAAPASDAAAPPPASASASSKPWYDGGLVPVLVVLGVLLAGGWFVFELRSSKRREREMPYGAPFMVAPPSWSSGGADATAELAKQLVKLTEIIVELATQRGVAPEAAPARPARARSPGAFARAGPEPDDRASPEPAAEAEAEAVANEPSTTPAPGPLRPAVPPPDDSPRPETVAPAAAEAARPDAPGDDPRPELLAQLTELDRERRRLRRVIDDDDDQPAMPRPVLPRPDVPAPAAAGSEAGLMARLTELDRDRRRLRRLLDEEEAGAGPEWPRPPRPVRPPRSEDP